MKLTYDQWLLHNDEELTIADAESGADREAGYDWDSKREEQYEKYKESK